MRLSPAENAGDIAVYPPAGVSAVNEEPLSADTFRACGPPTSAAAPEPTGPPLRMAPGALDVGRSPSAVVGVTTPTACGGAAAMAGDVPGSDGEAAPIARTTMAATLSAARAERTPADAAFDCTRCDQRAIRCRRSRTS